MTPTATPTPTLNDRFASIRTQEWRRFGDEQQLNGIEMAGRLHRLGLYRNLDAAIVAVSASWVNDTIKTGVSAWTRIA